MKIDTCSVCHRPAHAGETDDLDRRVNCRPVTADSLTAEQILTVLRDAGPNLKRTCHTALIPNMLMPLLSDEDHSAVIAARVHIAGIINAKGDKTP